MGCRNTVFHAAAAERGGPRPALRERGVRRFRDRARARDARTRCARIVGAYRRLVAGERHGRATCGGALRTESGYGVVRGSLRVMTQD